MRRRFSWLSWFMCVALLIGAIPLSVSAELSGLPLPAQPLRAWTLSLDGTVLVLDAENRLYRLDVTDLKVEARSAPLFEVSEHDRLFLAGGYAEVFVGSESSGRTLVLDMLHFNPVTELTQAGPMAVDWNGKLFMIYEQDIWAYRLMDPGEPPQLAVPGPEMGLGLVPTGLWAIQSPPRLFVRLHDASASPPHQHEFFRAYNLFDMSEAGTSGGELGVLGRPTVAKMGVFLSALDSMSPFYAGDKIVMFDSSAKTLHGWQPLDGAPVMTQDGAFVYLLRQRGLWVLNGRDMWVQGIVPFDRPPPADMMISPYGENLYLFGNGWLEVLETRKLNSAGFASISPFPPAWLDDATNHRPHNEPPAFRVYPSPQVEDDGTVLVQVGGYGETYRSVDGGRAWNLVRSLAFPGAQETPPLSLSPEFASDRTVVGRFPSSIMRSTDGGVKWSEWTPRIAFASDRSGNREIYSMAQDGSDVRQLTSHEASDEAPAWSPAWTQIAFQSDRSGNWDVFSTGVDCDTPAGCDVTRLTNDAADDVLPAWSPDGRSIAFVSTRDGNPEIYVMDRDGSEQHRLTFNPGGDWRPVWMPDSNHILFTSDRSGSNDIYSLAVPAPGEAAQAAEPNLQAIVTDPSDDRDPAINAYEELLFLSDRDGTLRAYTLDLKTPYSVLRPVNERLQPEGHPSWIDDVGFAALVSLERAGVTNIYRTCYACDYEPFTRGGGFDGHPAWGPVWWRPDISASLAWLEEPR